MQGSGPPGRPNEDEAERPRKRVKQANPAERDRSQGLTLAMSAGDVEGCAECAPIDPQRANRLFSTEVSKYSADQSTA
jgi:hypothetical protein